MEIERKFLVYEQFLDLDLNQYESKKINQFYIVYEPEVRFRKSEGKNNKYFMTVKSNGTLVRTEVECEISELLYETMKECKVGNVITKQRYIIDLENNTKCELDIFYGNLEGLKTVEIEFENEESAMKMYEYLPKWFGEEITYEKKYKNKNLSQLEYKDLN